jgi:hypothetical protein
LFRVPTRYPSTVGPVRMHVMRLQRGTEDVPCMLLVPVSLHAVSVSERRRSDKENAPWLIDVSIVGAVEWFGVCCMLDDLAQELLAGWGTTMTQGQCN